MQVREGKCVRTQDSNAGSYSLQEAVLFLLCIADEKEWVVVMNLRMADITDWLKGGIKRTWYLFVLF